MEEWKPIVCYEEKYQISNYGRVKSLNYRGKGKKVRCVELDKVFGSFTEAARKLGLEGINISRCCRNIKGYKTAGGYH